MRFGRALKEKKGFVIKPIQEDGACLFRAVCTYIPPLRFRHLPCFSPSADQVFGDEEMHATVRQNCMDYIVSSAMRSTNADESLSLAGKKRGLLPFVHHRRFRSLHHSKTSSALPWESHRNDCPFRIV